MRQNFPALKARLIILVSLLAVLVVCSAALAHGANDVRRDGNWWIGLSPNARLYFAVGFLDGIELGNKFSYWETLDKKDTHCADQAAASFYKYKKQYLVNVTNDQIVHGVNSFYSDHKNRRIRIDDAVWLVLENYRKNTTTD